MGLCISSEEDKVLASYDPMTASIRTTGNGLEETTFEISRSHAQRGPFAMVECHQSGGQLGDSLRFRCLHHRGPQGRTIHAYDVQFVRCQRDGRPFWARGFGQYTIDTSKWRTPHWHNRSLYDLRRWRLVGPNGFRNVRNQFHRNFHWLCEQWLSL